VCTLQQYVCMTGLGKGGGGHRARQEYRMSCTLTFRTESLFLEDIPRVILEDFDCKFTCLLMFFEHKD
jgi:hypothetical protein